MSESISRRQCVVVAKRVSCVDVQPDVSELLKLRKQLSRDRPVNLLGWLGLLSRDAQADAAIGDRMNSTIKRVCVSISNITARSSVVQNLREP
jgi:hypothetical protein